MAELQRFVTIEYFIKEMMGYKSKVSYYNHLNDEGWPQRVYPGSGKPLLRYEDCVAYQEMLLKQGGKRPTGTFKKRRLPPLPDGRKRHSGRPVKAKQSAA